MTDFFKNTCVLVTGGAGFIGSHLVHRLVALGARVTVLDNLSTGKKEYLNTILHAITFIEGDIINLETCLEATKHQKIIFHLAAQVSVEQSVKNPFFCFQTNVTGTCNMLESAHKNGVKRFLLASSSAVYGQKNKPCHEKDECKPSSPYGYSKLLAEQLVHQYAQVFKMPTLSLRFFNVWGERQNPDGNYAAVIAKFKHNMQKNIPITIFGDGSQTRDFMYVGDVVEASLTMSCLPLSLLQGQPVNIATGKSISLLELIDHLKKEFTNYPDIVTFAPERTGDIKYSAADCSQYHYLQSQQSQ